MPTLREARAKRRLFHELGPIPPAEFEENHYLQTESNQQVETQTIEPV
jgi:hypothetical protein